jgi:hypothetical protein
MRKPTLADFAVLRGDYQPGIGRIPRLEAALRDKNSGNPSLILGWSPLLSVASDSEAAFSS